MMNATRPLKTIRPATDRQDGYYVGLIKDHEEDDGGRKVYLTAPDFDTAQKLLNQVEDRDFTRLRHLYDDNGNVLAIIYKMMPHFIMDYLYREYVPNFSVFD